LAVANKMDLTESAANLSRFRRRHRVKVISISAQEGTGLSELLNYLKQKLL
jgi:50S ribosomal subunit-associated GTPase HflX